MPLPCAGYRPRDAERGVLHRVVDAHLDAFLDAAAAGAEGPGLPAFIEQEFRDFLACGVLAHGFARLRCGECAFERLVPFSCKARRCDLRDGHSGCVTVIQRFGGGLNLNVHFHTLVLDGVFTEGAEEMLRFEPTPPPTDEEIGVVLATIRTRVRRLLRRRGLDAEADVAPPDLLTEESAAFAGISSASIQRRIALGRRAGGRVWRLGEEPDAPWVVSNAPRHAHLDGFDLHANVAVPARDRARLEQLCRYLLRPAVAQDRLRLLGDGRVLLALKTAWADGTRHLLFEPMEVARETSRFDAAPPHQSHPLPWGAGAQCALARPRGGLWHRACRDRVVPEPAGLERGGCHHDAGAPPLAVG